MLYHVCMQTVAYLMTSELSGRPNYTTNCDFQLQLAHSQLQLQLQLGKNPYLINYNYNYRKNLIN